MVSIVWKTFFVHGRLSHSGALTQYATFRFHQGDYAPKMQMGYWLNTGMNGGSNTWLRFGLRNTSGAQVGASIQFNPGDNYVWKSFPAVPRGNYALNGRSQTGYLSSGWCEWNGDLRLRQPSTTP